LGWGDPVEAFPWPVVELRGDGGEGLGAVNAEVVNFLVGTDAG
jgi:hypothetical protein